MFDLDIRIIGKKQSRQMYQFYTFNTHEEVISAILKCIELVTNFLECDDMDVQFTSHVTTPDVITLYRNNHSLCAVFKIIERREYGSNRLHHKDSAATYQDRRESVSLGQHETLQECTSKLSHDGQGKD